MNAARELLLDVSQILGDIGTAWKEALTATVLGFLLLLVMAIAVVICGVMCVIGYPISLIWGKKP